MDILVSLIVAGIALVFGLVFALFPRWGIRVVCRSARSYMSEDLSTDPAQVIAFRIYGIAAGGLGLYALYQVIQAL
jgi:hypothetical protein